MSEHVPGPDPGDPPFAHLMAVIERLDEMGLRPGMFDRDEHRPLSEYPQMPQHTCYPSSRMLAGIYPELVAVYGHLALISGDVVVRPDHAWNTRADGRIIDSTFRPPNDRVNVVYVPDESGGQ